MLDDVGRGGVFFWRESGFVDDRMLSHNYTILISFKRVVPVEGNTAANLFWSFSIFPQQRLEHRILVADCTSLSSGTDARLRGLLRLTSMQHHVYAFVPDGLSALLGS